MSVVNFKRIGQLVDSVSRFQSNVEQAFKTVNECFASIATEYPQIDSGEGTLGAISPWATVNQGAYYRWTRHGSIVFFEIRAESTVASTSAAYLKVTFPDDVPKPKTHPNGTGDEWRLPASGLRTTSSGGTPVESGSGIYYTGGLYKIYTYTPTNQATKIWTANAYYQTEDY